MPSDAFDTMFLVRTSFNNKWRLEGRYRLHIQQKDNDEKTMLRNRVEQRARMRLSYDSPMDFPCRHNSMESMFLTRITTGDI